MGNALIYAGLAIGVAALAGMVFYGTEQQQVRMPDTVVDAPATIEGSFTSPSGLGAELNKEKWHEDPFADEAAEVRAKAGL